MDLLADTTFLIDLWREKRAPGPATSFAHRSSGFAVGIPWVVAGEFLAGGAAVGHPESLLRPFLERYAIVHTSASIIQSYASLYAALRKEGRSPGVNDLWIAACAAAMDRPLITRNAKDFEGIPKVSVVTYA